MNPNPGNFLEDAAREKLAGMPLFNGFTDLDFGKMLELMQAPVRSIDTCMGKEQLRTVAKQLLVQNLALQTKVRNLEIAAIGESQAFDEAMDEIDKAIRLHTDFSGMQELMEKVAAEQDANEAQGQLPLVHADSQILADMPPSATHYDAKAKTYVSVGEDGDVSVWDEGQWFSTEPSNEWIASLQVLDVK